MQKFKFKVGDIIEPIEMGRGFEQAKVLKIFIEKEETRFKGRKMYLLKIPCGVATIPIEAEEFYKLVDKRKAIRV